MPATRPGLDAGGSLLTGEAVALDVRPANVIMRSGSAIIDMLLSIGGILLSVWIVASLLGVGLDQAGGQAALVALAVVWLVVVPMTVETLSGGRSLGRLALGIRVVRDDGGGIAIRHAFVRALTGVLEIYLTLGSLAFIVGLLNTKAKRLGDLLAGTHAQIERVPRPPRHGFGVPPALAAWAAVADVGRLPDPLARRIAAYFDHVAQLDPARREFLAASLLREAATHVAPMPDAPAELVLAGIVALRRDRDLTGLALERERIERLEPVLDALPHRFPER